MTFLWSVIKQGSDVKNRASILYTFVLLYSLPGVLYERTKHVQAFLFTKTCGFLP